ncbi:uncharacterized protein [Clytia hemisphaerica]|uniref:uncharacterized protein isoform X2 n=1 Tax=Clytia hemisphaerica TaxID=252671 RepID=UPI0034D7A199
MSNSQYHKWVIQKLCIIFYVGLTCATFSFKYEFQCVHDLNQSCQIQFQPTQVYTEKVLLVYYFKVNGCHSTLSMYTGKRRTRPLETGKPYIKTNNKITLFVNTAFCHSTVLYVFAKPVDTSVQYELKAFAYDQWSLSTFNNGALSDKTHNVWLLPKLNNKLYLVIKIDTFATVNNDIKSCVSNSSLVITQYSSDAGNIKLTVDSCSLIKEQMIVVTLEPSDFSTLHLYWSVSNPLLYKVNGFMNLDCGTFYKPFMSPHQRLEDSYIIQDVFTKPTTCKWIFQSDVLMTVDIAYTDNSKVCDNKVELNGLDYFEPLTVSRCVLQDFKTPPTKFLMFTYTTYHTVRFSADIRFFNNESVLSTATPSLSPSKTTATPITTTTTLKPITHQPTSPKTLTPDTKDCFDKREFKFKNGKTTERLDIQKQFRNCNQLSCACKWYVYSKHEFTLDLTLDVAPVAPITNTECPNRIYIDDGDSFDMQTLHGTCKLKNYASPKTKMIQIIYEALEDSDLTAVIKYHKVVSPRPTPTPSNKPNPSESLSKHLPTESSKQPTLSSTSSIFTSNKPSKSLSTTLESQSSIVVQPTPSVTDNSENKRNPELYIIVGVIAGVFCLVLLLICCLCRMRRGRTKEANYPVLAINPSSTSTIESPQSAGGKQNKMKKSNTSSIPLVELNSLETMPRKKTKKSFKRVFKSTFRRSAKATSFWGADKGPHHGASKEIGKDNLAQTTDDGDGMLELYESYDEPDMMQNKSYITMKSFDHKQNKSIRRQDIAIVASGEYTLPTNEPITDSQNNNNVESENIYNIPQNDFNQQPKQQSAIGSDSTDNIYNVPKTDIDNTTPSPSSTVNKDAENIYNVPKNDFNKMPQQDYIIPKTLETSNQSASDQLRDKERSSSNILYAPVSYVSSENSLYESTPEPDVGSRGLLYPAQTLLKKASRLSRHFSRSSSTSSDPSSPHNSFKQSASFSDLTKNTVRENETMEHGRSAVENNNGGMNNEYAYMQSPKKDHSCPDNVLYSSTGSLLDKDNPLYE